MYNLDMSQSTIHNTSSVASTVRNKDYFKAHKLSGIYRDYDRLTGDLIEEGEFRNGVEVGLWKVIDEDGDEQHFRYAEERIGAMCRDGSMSSATGRGACSWHGGVAEWIMQNKRYQVGGTGKYVPIEERIIAIKKKLKDQLKMNANKPQDELFLEVADKLLKEAKKPQIQQNENLITEEELQMKLVQVRSQYEYEIETLNERVKILENETQELHEKNARLQEELRNRNSEPLKQREARQHQHMEELQNLTEDYQDKLDEAYKQADRLRKELAEVKEDLQREIRNKRIQKMEGKQKFEDKQETVTAEKKKNDEKGKDSKNNVSTSSKGKKNSKRGLKQKEDVRMKILKIQKQMEELSKTILEKDEGDSEIQNSSESQNEQESEPSGEQERQPLRSSSSSLQEDEPSIIEPHAQTHNQSFSYSKILNSTLFKDQKEAKLYPSLNQSQEKSTLKKQKSKADQSMNASMRKNSNNLSMSINKKGLYQFTAEDYSEDEDRKIITPQKKETLQVKGLNQLSSQKQEIKPKLREQNTQSTRNHFSAGQKREQKKEQYDGDQEEAESLKSSSSGDDTSRSSSQQELQEKENKHENKEVFRSIPYSNSQI